MIGHVVPKDKTKVKELLENKEIKPESFILPYGSIIIIKELFDEQLFSNKTFKHYKFVRYFRFRGRVFQFYIAYSYTLTDYASKNPDNDIYLKVFNKTSDEWKLIVTANDLGLVPFSISNTTSELKSEFRKYSFHVFKKFYEFIDELYSESKLFK